MGSRHSMGPPSSGQLSFAEYLLGTRASKRLQNRLRSKLVKQAVSTLPPKCGSKYYLEFTQIQTSETIFFSLSSHKRLQSEAPKPQKTSDMARKSRNRAWVGRQLKPRAQQTKVRKWLVLPFATSLNCN